MADSLFSRFWKGLTRWSSNAPDSLTTASAVSRDGPAAVSSSLATIATPVALEGAHLASHEASDACSHDSAGHGELDQPPASSLPPTLDGSREQQQQPLPCAEADSDFGTGSSRKRRRGVTDLSDRAIQLCAQDAILAVHRRAVSLGIVDPETSEHDLLRALGTGGPGGQRGRLALPLAFPPPRRTEMHTVASNWERYVQSRALDQRVVKRQRTSGGDADGTNLMGGIPQLPSPSRDHGATASTGASSSQQAAAAEPAAFVKVVGSTTVLDGIAQSPLYHMLYSPITSLLHDTALRRHACCQSCTIQDVLRVAELAQRIFLLVPMSSRGSFARTCREWHEISNSCWRADDFKQVEAHSVLHLRSMRAPVAQLVSWVRTNQVAPCFFLLILTERGHLEQLRIARRADLGSPSQPASATPTGAVENEPQISSYKTWALEQAIPEGLDSSVGAQLVVTKHHAYCVVAVRGQALLVKLGGMSSGLHEHVYTERFPSHVTAMAMCPQDNNIIAFGVPPTSRIGEAGSNAPGTPGPTILLGPHADQAIIEAAAGPASGAAGVIGASVSGVGGEGAVDLSKTCTIAVINFAQSTTLQKLHTRHREEVLQLDYAPESLCLLSCSADCVQLWRALPSSPTSATPGIVETQPLRTLLVPSLLRIKIAKVHPDWTSVLIATTEALEVRDLRGCMEADPYHEGRAEEPAVAALLSLKWKRDNLQVTAVAFIAQGSMLAVSDRGDRLLILTYQGLQPVKKCRLPWGLSHPVAELATQPRGDTASIAPRRIRTVTAISQCPDVSGVSGEWREGGPIAVASAAGEVVLIKVGETTARLSREGAGSAS